MSMELEPVRRDVTFRDFSEVLRDIEVLQDRGYRAVGNWNLAQTCGHLAEWLRYPLDGYPRPPLPVRGMFWVLRHTVGPRQLRKSLEQGAMPDGVPTAPESVPDRGADEEAEVNRLRQAIERFERHAGRFQPSPVFGELDRETAIALQLLHCTHHLRFLIPRQ